MTFSIKFSLTIFLIIIFQITSFSQSQEKINHTIHIGYPSMFFDNPELGFHLGYNPNIKISERFSAEGQLSYTGGKFEQDDDFFAHNGGHIQVINILGGSRFHFIKNSNPKNFYLNLLLGFAYVNEKELFGDGENFLVNNQFMIGYSAGLYYKTKQNLSFGIALETNSMTTLKLGYQF